MHRCGPYSGSPGGATRVCSGLDELWVLMKMSQRKRNRGTHVHEGRVYDIDGEDMKCFWCRYRKYGI